MKRLYAELTNGTAESVYAAPPVLHPGYGAAERWAKQLFKLATEEDIGVHQDILTPWKFNELTKALDHTTPNDIWHVMQNNPPKQGHDVISWSYWTPAAIKNKSAADNAPAEAERKREI